jgi:hypothetical protein
MKVWRIEPRGAFVLCQAGNALARQSPPADEASASLQQLS